MLLKKPSELEMIIESNHKSEIAAVNKSCEIEHNRITRELANNSLKFKLLNSKLEDKNSQIEEDSRELIEQKKLSSKKLIDIKIYEDELKVKINDFNSSKKEYNRLLSALHVDKKKLADGMNTVTDIINRKKYIYTVSMKFLG